MMLAEELRLRIDAALKKHALAAQAAQYDRTVSVSAIAAAREAVEKIKVAQDCQDYGDRVLYALKLLLENYNDSDGTYTNGRGVIGSLLDDVEAMVRKACSK